MANQNNHRNWRWLIAGIILIAAMFPLDDKVDAALVVSASSPLHKLAWWCSKIGEGWVVGVVGILLAVFFVRRKKMVLAANIFFIGFTSEIAGLAALILRVIFGRTRPTAPVPQGFYSLWHDGHWLIGKYQFSSFPSGHSATAAGLAAAAWLVNRRWGTIAWAYAIAVMWSRIALNCHHLSDVVASTVLSIAVALWLKKYFAPCNEKFFSRLVNP